MCLKNTHDIVYVVFMEIFDRIYRNTDLHERIFTQVSCLSLGERSFAICQMYCLWAHHVPHLKNASINITNL